GRLRARGAGKGGIAMRTTQARPATASLLLVLMLLSGCATPESRLRTALIEAGLPEDLSACMADRMVDRLSLAQLYRLSDLKRAGRAERVDQFLHSVRSLGDAEIWTVTSSTAALCAAGFAG